MACPGVWLALCLVSAIAAFFTALPRQQVPCRPSGSRCIAPAAPATALARPHGVPYSRFLAVVRPVSNATLSRFLRAVPLPAALPLQVLPLPLAQPRLLPVWGGAAAGQNRPQRLPLNLFGGLRDQPKGEAVAVMSRLDAALDGLRPGPMELLRTVTMSDDFPTGLAVTKHRPGVVEYFELAEGLRTNETLYFKVTGRPLINLKRQMSTYMSKLKMVVETKVVDLGSYAPSAEECSFAFPATQVPSGLIIRGHYRTTVEFFDDAGPVCPPLVKEFTIVRQSHRFQIPAP